MFARKFLFFVTAFFSTTTASANITWSAPVTVYSSMGENPQGAKISLHPTSHAAAVIWKTENEGNYTIQASHFDGADWASPADLGTSSRSPRIDAGIYSSGGAVAVWDQFDEDLLSVRAAVFDGSNWGSVTVLESLGSTYFAPMPTLSVNSFGVAVINWHNQSNILRGVTYYNEAWLFPYLLSEEGLAVSTAVPSPLRIASTNLATTVLFTSSSILSYATNALSPDAVPDNINLLPYNVVAADPIFKMDQASGRGAFIFQYPENKFIILATNYSETALLDSWNYTIAAVPNPKSNVVSFDLALNPNNPYIAAVWELSDGRVQVNTFNGVEWKIAATLSTSGSSPTIAVNPINNHIIAAWADLTAGGSDNTIKTTEFDGTNWADPVSISSGSTTPGSPRIEINSEGYGIIIWDRLVGSDTIIEAATSE